MKIAAIVILYNPEKETVANIKTYYDFVEKIFVYDNSTVESAIKKELLQLPKVEFYQDFENRGISERLNSACEKAIENNFEWLLTMDQDSHFQPGSMPYYLDCVSRFPQREKVAVFGTQNDKPDYESKADCLPKEVDELITSGSLMNLLLFNEIGKFDEKLFIDYVDNDYCYRAKLCGYSLIKLMNISIMHELGKSVYRSSIKTLFLFKKNKTVHPPLRCYYLYRNMLYLSEKYNKVKPELSKKIHKEIWNHVKKSIFYGRQEWKTFRYIALAKKDYKDNKMGKISRVL